MHLWQRLWENFEILGPAEIVRNSLFALKLAFLLQDYCVFSHLSWSVSSMLSLRQWAGPQRRWAHRSTARPTGRTS
jgi:hypothetical protein